MRNSDKNGPPAAPDGLSDRSVAVWAQIIGDGMVSPGRRVLLEQALRALDRADAAAAVVAAEGLVATTPPAAWCESIPP